MVLTICDQEIGSKAELLALVKDKGLTAVQNNAYSIKQRMYDDQGDSEGEPDEFEYLQERIDAYVKVLAFLDKMRIGV